ncbi:hypothetical protein QE450_003594 [Paenibacillus sp. SORGH_AS306]|uniref:S-layer homology domain-containing protein n=1 Tax=unclassified Paenibacillus TaxID=185978 RepID=UPI0027899524|nr:MULTISPECIES: S-layer homology domain-containing protein [unclassified Paenibacillus]MDQ1236096.1 hypothetical protein [Paenibacillus sp. SORGH_AS_0306]MDR6108451.1 hypothetical protein [Paenibacillus sp. SORGH_AS_0338]
MSSNPFDQRRLLQTGICSLMAVLLLLPPLPTHASELARHAQNGQDTFLGGTYIELGVSSSGTLGTASDSPSGFHPGAIRRNIGMNVDKDGYDFGKDMTSGDYVLPGSPSEGFVVGYKPSVTSKSPLTFVNEEQSGSIDIPSTTQDLSTDEQLIAQTSGNTSDQAIAVQQNISFKPGDAFFKTTITLKNNSVTDSVYDVHYMRFLDPDIDADLHEDNSTINWVPSNPPQDAEAIAAAIGNASDNIFMYVAQDPRAQASVGFSRNPYIEPAFQTDGGKHIAANLTDDWLTLTFNAGDLEPGGTTELVFYSSLDSDMNGALAQIREDYAADTLAVPSEITLTGDTIAWNVAEGTTAGVLTTSTQNPKVQDTFTYSLVSGEGSSANDYFTIQDNQVKTTKALTRGVTSYPIRVLATGSNGSTLEQAFVIHATAPDMGTDLASLSIENGALTPSFSPENTAYAVTLPDGTTQTTVKASVYDPDASLIINGVTVTDSVYAEEPVTLDPGLTTITLEVHGKNGISKFYKVQVSSNSTLPPVVPVDSTQPVQPVPQVPTPSPTTDTYEGLPVSPPLVITAPFVPVAPTEPLPDPNMVTGGGGGGGASGASALDDNPIYDELANAATGTATNKNTDSATKTPTKSTTNVKASSYIQGYPDGTFRPDQKVTRAELSVMLERALAIQNATTPTATSSTDFKDVPASYWAASSIQNIEGSGWLQGYPGGNFKPAQPMTRAELATLIARWQGLNTTSTASLPADVQGHWAANTISEVIQSGWMKGYPDGQFYPNQAVSRAEIVTVLNRVLGENTSSTDSIASSWKDVTPGHWAYSEITKASQK